MERIVVEYLANAVWQIPLLAAGVGALLWALDSDLQTRHRAWLAVLVVAVLIPFRGMEIVGAVPDAAIAAVSAQDPVPPETVVIDPAPSSGLVIGPAATRWLVRIYIAVSLFAAWRILRAWIAAQGLLRRARPMQPAPRAMAIFAQVADGQGIPLPRLRQSDETVSPVVIGAVRPVLLLPAGFDQLKDDEILAALSHEFAHLKRRDYLINLLCQLVALPVAWHPAIHLVQKRIRDTREMLCDAVAAGEMASSVRYATCLVAFALRAIDDRHGALATQGLSMFDNRILEERILNLTQERALPEPRTRLARLAGASLGMVVAVALAMMVHVTPTLAEPTPDDPQGPVQLTPPVDLPAIPAPPAPPAAPAAPPAPAVHHHEHASSGQSADMRRAIAEEEREKAQDRSERQRERAQEEAERQRERAESQREVIREAARTAREATREAAEEMRRHAAEINRAAAEASAKVQSPEFKAQMAQLQAQMQQLHDNMAQLHQHMKEMDKEMEKSLTPPL